MSEAEAEVKKNRVAEITDKLIGEISYKNVSLPDSFFEEMASIFKSAGSKRKNFLFNPALVVSFAVIVFFAGFFAGRIVTPIESAIKNFFEQSVIASVNVEKGESFTVRLVYDSEDDVEDVDFHISLPEGLAFSSDYPEIAGTKTINWSGNLKKGRNEIPFVVQAVAQGTWKINAAAQFKDTVLNHEIIVNSSPEEPVNETENGNRNNGRQNA